MRVPPLWHALPRRRLLREDVPLDECHALEVIGEDTRREESCDASAENRSMAKRPANHVTTRAQDDS